ALAPPPVCFSVVAGHDLDRFPLSVAAPTDTEVVGEYDLQVKVHSGSRATTSDIFDVPRKRSVHPGHALRLTRVHRADVEWPVPPGHEDHGRVDRLRA